MRHVEKTIRVEDLVHDSTNPRNHDSIDNRRSVQSSLKAHGQVVPILVQAGTNRIIHGNLRVETMREMGIQEASCWVIEADDLEAKRLAITLNKTGELASWNQDVLTDQLKELSDSLPDFDLEDLGFDASILDTDDPFGGEEVNEEYFDDAFNTDDEGDDEHSAPSTPAGPESTVIQVFVKPEDASAFTEAIQYLADHWGLDTSSDVIVKCIKAQREVLDS